jgi:hypothetical protein
MMKNMVQSAVIVLSLIASMSAAAQDNALVGDWTITSSGFSFVGSSTVVIHLTVENQDGQLKAYIYNGPASIRIEGNEFEVDLDWASGFDEAYLSTFRGHLTGDDTLEGELIHHGATNFLGRAWQNGTFKGKRSDVPANLDKLPATPVDMSGVYNRASGLGAVRKLAFSMTPRGQAIIDDYLEMDNANSRCASPGLVLASGFPYPMEILHTDNYIVIVYGADYARRIYLDGREFPETATSSSLGFSVGEWKGETLVVTTTMLNPAFMSTRGQPVSADAYTTEYFYFDDKGYLHADMWLHDAVNYTRPPYLRRVYDQNFNLPVITKIDCDPYSFFRALALEGQLEEFWSRSTRRR